MKRLVVALVAALSLIAGTGTAALAVPPDTGAICNFAEARSGQDFPCERY